MMRQRQEPSSLLDEFDDLSDPQVDQVYKVDLQINFSTQFGEYLCVTGNLKALGEWKEFVCKLKWTEGHNWVTEKPIESTMPFFQYKYVVLDGKDQPKKWEEGLNRIADVTLL